MKAKSQLFFAGICMLLSACAKEDVLPTRSQLEGKQKSPSSSSSTSTIQYVIGSQEYQYITTLLPTQTVYYLSEVNPATGASYNWAHAYCLSNNAFMPSLFASGTAACDGTTLFSTNQEGNTFAFPASSTSSGGPISSSPLMYASTVFIPDETECFGGQVYAISKMNMNLYRLDNMSTSAPTVAFTGLMLSGVTKANAALKTIYRKQTATSNSLNMALANLSTGLISLYTINSSTGIATFVQSVSGITFTATSNLSAYHDNKYLYLRVQENGSNLNTVYRINSSGTASIVSSGTLGIIFDYCVVQ